MRSPRPADALAVRTPEVIRVDESYSIPEFKRRSTLGAYAFTQARRAGLRVIEVGKKRFVRGADWHAFLDAAADSQGDPP